MSALQQESPQLLKPAPLATGAIRAVDPASPEERREWPLVELVLKRLALRHRETLFDAGCLNGLVCAMAAAGGAKVAGADPSPMHVAHARRRNPHGEFEVGQLDGLPFRDGQFDAISAVNALHRVAHPSRALRELRRVLRGGGRIALVSWADPRACESANCFDLVSEAREIVQAGMPGPYAFADASLLCDLLERAGFGATQVESVAVMHEFPDLANARLALVGDGHAPPSMLQRDERRQLDALARALAPYRMSCGGYQLRNRFRLVLARAR